jgi:hypothetical protein
MDESEEVEQVESDNDRYLTYNLEHLLSGIETYYNRVRWHSTLGDVSPLQYKREQINVRYRAI